MVAVHDSVKQGRQAHVVQNQLRIAARTSKSHSNAFRHERLNQLFGTGQNVLGAHALNQVEVPCILLVHQLHFGLLIESQMPQTENVIQTVDPAQSLQRMIVFFGERNAQLFRQTFPRDKVMHRRVHDDPVHVEQACFQPHPYSDFKMNSTWYRARPSMGFLMMLPTRYPRSAQAFLRASWKW